MTAQQSRGWVRLIWHGSCLISLSFGNVLVFEESFDIKTDAEESAPFFIVKIEEDFKERVSFLLLWIKAYFSFGTQQ